MTLNSPHGRGYLDPISPYTAPKQQPQWGKFDLLAPMGAYFSSPHENDIKKPPRWGYLAPLAPISPHAATMGANLTY